MKQVLQIRSGSTVVRDVPAPPCPVGGVLVRNAYSVISSGTERSRVALSQKSLLGKARERPDLVRDVVDRARREGFAATRQAVSRQLSSEMAVGYSSAGVVIEVGRSVRGLNPGDRVACCGGGHASHAEIVAMPRNLVARVPDGVRLDTAAFATIAAIALHGIRLADVRLGERVAVVGCGLVGQLSCRLLAASGAEVFALDIDRSRVEAAVSGGADHGIPVSPNAAARVLAATHGIGVDSVLVTAAASTNDPLLLAAEIARDRASVVLVGAVPVDFPRASLYDKELSFRISRSYGPGRYDPAYEERGLDYPIGYVRWTEQRNLDAVLDLIARGRLTVDGLIDEVIPVDEAERAYERLVGPAEQRPLGAIVISYPESQASPASGRVVGRRAPEASTGAVRVGLIGPGGFASRVLIPAFLGAGAQLEVVGGGAGPSAEAATRTLGFARAAESDEAVVDDPDIDVVVIATRHGSHAQLATRALAAGKHVFVEKPLALTDEELEAVLTAARASNRVLTVGFNRRFSPLLRRVRDFTRESPAPLAASYRVSAGHIDASHWVHDLEQGGGRALGEVCHFIDSLAFVAGAPVDQVHTLGHGAPELPIQSRDNLAIVIHLVDGSVGTVLYAADGAPRVAKERLEVFRGDRTAILDDYSSVELYSGGKRARVTVKGQDKGHRAEVADFVAAIREGRESIPLAELENVTRATFAVVESMRLGLPIRVEEVG